MHWHRPDLQMEPRRAARILVRTKSAIRPSVNVQSVPHLLAASPHAMLNTVIKKIQMQSVLDCVESPCNESYRRTWMVPAGPFVRHLRVAR